MNGMVNVVGEAKSLPEVEVPLQTHGGGESYFSGIVCFVLFGVIGCTK